MFSILFTLKMHIPHTKAMRIAQMFHLKSWNHMRPLSITFEMWVSCAYAFHHVTNIINNHSLVIFSPSYLCRLRIIITHSTLNIKASCILSSNCSSKHPKCRQIWKLPIFSFFLALVNRIWNQSWLFLPTHLLSINYLNAMKSTENFMYAFRFHWISAVIVQKLTITLDSLLSQKFSVLPKYYSAWNLPFWQ